MARSIARDNINFASRNRTLMAAVRLNKTGLDKRKLAADGHLQFLFIPEYARAFTRPLIDFH
jgi:hypothetical protein